VGKALSSKRGGTIFDGHRSYLHSYLRYFFPPKTSIHRALLLTPTTDLLTTDGDTGLSENIVTNLCYSPVCNPIFRGYGRRLGVEPLLHNLPSTEYRRLYRYTSYKFPRFVCPSIPMSGVTGAPPSIHHHPSPFSHRHRLRDDRCCRPPPMLRATITSSYRRRNHRHRYDVAHHIHPVNLVIGDSIHSTIIICSPLIFDTNAPMPSLSPAPPVRYPRRQTRRPSWHSSALVHHHPTTHHPTML
jgi:hypothetical protein